MKANTSLADELRDVIINCENSIRMTGSSTCQVVWKKSGASAEVYWPLPKHMNMHSVLTDITSDEGLQAKVRVDKSALISRLNLAAADFSFVATSMEQLCFDSLVRPHTIPPSCLAEP